jgi:hypothetical protein
MNATSAADAIERTRAKEARRQADQERRDAEERANLAGAEDRGPELAPGDPNVSAAPAACTHENLARNGTSRRTPVRCKDCGLPIDVAGCVALLIGWIDRSEGAIGELRARVASLERTVHHLPAGERSEF